MGHHHSSLIVSIILASIYVYFADGQRVDCSSISINDPFAIYRVEMGFQRRVYAFSGRNTYEFDSELDNGAPSLISVEKLRQLAEDVIITAVAQASDNKIVAFGRNV